MSESQTIGAVSVSNLTRLRPVLDSPRSGELPDHATTRRARAPSRGPPASSWRHVRRRVQGSHSPRRGRDPAPHWRRPRRGPARLAPSCSGPALDPPPTDTRRSGSHRGAMEGRGDHRGVRPHPARPRDRASTSTGAGPLDSRRLALDGVHLRREGLLPAVRGVRGRAVKGRRARMPQERRSPPSSTPCPTSVATLTGAGRVTRRRHPERRAVPKSDLAATFGAAWRPTPTGPELQLDMLASWARSARSAADVRAMLAGVSRRELAEAGIV